MKKTIILILKIICILIFIFSVYSIIKWYIENNKNDSIKKHVIEITDIKEEFDTHPFINTNLDNVEIENKDVIGWIKVPNTNINYPVLQYKDNEYYLNHSFDNSYSSAGWIFVDYRNNIDEDTNIIVYGHNRLDNSMFGTLKNTLNQEYLNNNKYIYFNTLNNMNTYEIFSVYKTNENDFKGYINFKNKNDYKKYLTNIKNKSIIKLDVEVNTTDKIITLYTCDNTNNRTILHAKLIQTKKY